LSSINITRIKLESEFKEVLGVEKDESLELLESLDRPLSEVALLIPHQANKRIIDAVGHKLGIEEDRVFINVDRYGNTGSATVPLGLWEAYEQKRIQPGDLVMLTAFGAGFHWASAAMQF